MKTNKGKEVIAMMSKTETSFYHIDFAIATINNALSEIRTEYLTMLNNLLSGENLSIVDVLDRTSETVAELTDVTNNIENSVFTRMDTECRGRNGDGC